MADLFLVRISPEYPVGERNLALRTNTLEGNDGVFYAVEIDSSSPHFGGVGYVTIIVPESDPRHAGMWNADSIVPGHYGWNVPVSRVTRFTAESLAVLLGNVPENGSQTPSDARLVEVLAELASAQETIANLRESATRQAREFEAWKERAQRVATQYANDNELCGEFDRCMEEIGLEGRRREYRVTVTVEVEAADEDDAWEIFVENYATDSCYADVERA